MLPLGRYSWCCLWVGTAGAAFGWVQLVLPLGGYSWCYVLWCEDIYQYCTMLVKCYYSSVCISCILCACINVCVCVHVYVPRTLVEELKPLINEAMDLKKTAVRVLFPHM